MRRCRATDPSIDMKILIPSFGASAVLLFAVPESKLSQPRNFVGESGACSNASSLRCLCYWHSSEHSCTAVQLAVTPYVVPQPCCICISTAFAHCRRAILLGSGGLRLP